MTQPRAAAVEQEAAPAAAPSGAFARLDTSAEPVVRTAEEDAILRDLGGKEAWERFLSQIRETKLTLGIWLMSARVARFSENMLSLSFSPQNRFAREMVLEAKNRRFIEFHAEKFFGRKIVIQASEHFESRRGGAEARRRGAEAAGDEGAGAEEAAGFRSGARRPRGGRPRHQAPDRRVRRGTVQGKILIELEALGNEGHGKASQAGAADAGTTG